MIEFEERYPGASGIIGEFLDVEDVCSAQVQIDTAYIAGWNEFHGFKPCIDFDDPRNSYMEYTGDPPTAAKAFAYFRDELIIVFDHDWTLITKRAGNASEFTIARLD